MITTKKRGPVQMLVIYRANKGHDDALLELVKSHWPTIRKLGLATSWEPMSSVMEGIEIAQVEFVQ